MIPVIPYQIVTSARVGGAVRRETRNAKTLAQATDIADKELRKPATRRVEVWVCLQTADRHGGVEENGR